MDTLEQQAVLARINASISSTALRDIVLAEAVLLGLALDAYAALSPVTQAEIMRDAFINRPANTGYSDVAAFVRVFDTIVSGQRALHQAVEVANTVLAADDSLIGEVRTVVSVLQEFSAGDATTLSGQTVANLILYGNALISVYDSFDHPGRVVLVDYLTEQRPTSGYTSFDQVLTVVQTNIFSAYSLAKAANNAGKLALAEVNAAADFDTFKAELLDSAPILALDLAAFQTLSSATGDDVIAGLWALRPVGGFASVSALNEPFETAVQHAVAAEVGDPDPPPEVPVVVLPEIVVPAAPPALVQVEGTVLNRKGGVFADFESLALTTTDPHLRLEAAGESLAEDGGRLLSFRLVADAGEVPINSMQFQLVSAGTMSIEQFVPADSLAAWSRVQAIEGSALRFAAASPDISFSGNRSIGTLTLRVGVEHSDALTLAVDQFALGKESPRSLFLHYDTFAATSQGQYQVDSLQGGLVDLDFVASVAGLPRGAITAQDALEALRLAVRLPSDHANPYGIIAADYNQDGRVTAVDALEILRYAVRLPGALQPDWVFLSDAADLSSISTRNTVFADGFTQALTESALQVEFSAVLLGDVNDSYSPAFV